MRELSPGWKEWPEVDGDETYWCRERGREGMEFIVRLFRTVGGTTAQKIGCAGYLFKSDFRNYEFLGPITPAERAATGDDHQRLAELQAYRDDDAPQDDAPDAQVAYPCVVDEKTLFACLQTAEQVFRKPDEPARLERFRRTKAKLFAQAKASHATPEKV